MVTSLQPASAGNSRSGGSASASGQGDLADFKAIISAQRLTPEGMARLQELLPPEQFSQLEALLEGGNGLPLSADIADPAHALGNASLLQWMLQLAGTDGVGDEIAVTLGGQSGAGTALTVADLRAMLLRQGGSGLSAYGASEPGGRSFSPTPDNPAAQLLVKGELPVEGAGFKPALVAAELPASLLKGDGQATATPLSAVVSGLEQLSARRPEVFTPPDIPLPTGTKGWDNLLSNRVMWMVGNQLQQASVHITPRHLGPIDIQVSIQNDQTSVSFLAQNAAVKEALEAAIPRLREMFADNNLQLVNVDVGQRDSGDRASGADLFQQPASGDGNNLSAPGQRGGDDDNAQAEIDPVGTLASSGLVDDYA
jgi:hypothetical protein